MRINKLSRASLMMGASAFVLAAFAAPAFAQDATPASPPPVAKKADKKDDQIIVVTARRKALQTATERKKNSDTIIDSVVADDAGKLPDTSVTEVLQRLSGVTITRFASLSSPDQYSSEGSGVQVRGLSGVQGLVNGREVFSANGGSGLNWGDITPELLAAVDVYKATTANLIEGGIAGTIDLRTRMPFDYKKPEFDANFSDNYADFVKKSAQSGSILLTKRWDTPVGEFGALMDLAQSNYVSGDSFIRTEPYYQNSYQGKTVYVPGGFDWGNDSFQRTRRGAYLAFQWKPNNQLQFWQTDFVSSYKTSNGGGGVFAAYGANAYLGAGTDTFDSRGVFQSGTNIEPSGSTASSPATYSLGNANNYTPSVSTTADFSQGFIYNASSKLRISGALQYVDSWYWSGDYGLGEGVNLSNFDISLNGTGLPNDSLPGAASLLSNPANYGVSSIIWNQQKNHGHAANVNLDVDYDLGDGFFRSLKVGVRHADRIETDDFTGTWWSPVAEGWNGSPQVTANQVPNAVSPYNFPNFFSGKISSPGQYYFINTIKGNGYFNYDLNTFANGVYAPGTTFASLATPTLSQTRILTNDAYISSKFASDDAYGWLPAFSGNIGLRVVNDKVIASGPYTQGASPGNTPSYFYLNQADALAGLQAVGGLAGAAAQTTGALPDTTALTYENNIRQQTNSYTFALPSVNVNFKPTSTFFIRVAVGQTLTPPGFSDVRSGGATGVTTQTNPYNGTVVVGGKSETVTLPGILQGYTFSGGDTALKPQIATNEDISFEWYPDRSFSTHLDFFNKSVRGLIVNQSTQFPLTASAFNAATPTQAYNLTAPVTEAFDINASQRATIDGWEFEARKFFDFLPSPYNGFGVDFNYTRINSKVPSTVGEYMDGTPVSNVPYSGLSKTSYNVSLMYNKGPWDGQLSWNWRSRYLATTTGNGTDSTYTDTIQGTPAFGQTIAFELPVYAAAYGQLDAGASYKVNDHVRIGIKATNLNHETVKTYEEILKNVLVVRSWYDVDRRYEANISISY